MTVSFIPATMRISARFSRRGSIACYAVTLAFTGCGPSFEAIQEGDLRFAHCDRLDLDPNIAPSHRLHCWREWRRVYTYGQTRDRVEYAQRRIAEVVSGDTEPGFALPSGERRPDRRRTPSVLSPEVPPPALVAPPADPAAPAPPSTSGEAPLPNPEPDTGCRLHCQSEEVRCTPGCEARPTGCQNCWASFEKCVQHCRSEGIPY